MTDADGRRLLGGLAPDVTEQRKVEVRSSMVLSAARAGLWEFNLRTGLGDWSDELYRMLGFSPQSVAPTLELWKSLVHPDDLAGSQAKVAELIAGHVQEVEHEYRIVRPDGTTIWVSLQGRVLPGVDVCRCRCLAFYWTSRISGRCSSGWPSAVDRGGRQLVVGAADWSGLVVRRILSPVRLRAGRDQAEATASFWRCSTRTTATGSRLNSNCCSPAAN